MKTGKPIYYEFTSCPAAEFAIRHGLTDIMPALCNVDYASMALLHARLVRTTTCVDGCRCDYTICGDKDPYLKGASRIPGRGGIQAKQIILQCKGGETNGNLYWNHDPFLGHNTGLGLRVLYEKNPLAIWCSAPLAGFAAGVMVAASIWSLLIPAIEQSEGMGKLSFLPAFIGFWVGVLFLLLLDHLIPPPSCGKQSGGGTEKQAGPHHHDGAGGDPT